MRPGGQVVVFPSKTAGTSSYVPPPPPTPQQIAAGRRRFVKMLVGVSALLSLAPYVPWGTFLSNSISAGKGYGRQQVTIDNSPSDYGIAAGKKVNAADLATFPPNSHWVLTYPTSGDPTVDAQNKDTFVKYELIRLPTELGGDKKDASAFVAFSALIRARTVTHPPQLASSTSNTSAHATAASTRSPADARSMVRRPCRRLRQMRYPSSPSRPIATVFSTSKNQYGM